MTPEEKAKELVEKFRPYCAIDIARVPIGRDRYAKQCALLAVDEVIDENKSYYQLINSNRYHYWHKVKEEINKI